MCFLETVPGYTFYEDQDCGGNDFIGVRNASVAKECADICDSTEGCVAFVHDTRSTTKNCHCKNVCENLGNLQDVHTYKKGIYSSIKLSIF